MREGRNSSILYTGYELLDSRFRFTRCSTLFRLHNLPPFSLPLSISSNISFFPSSSLSIGYYRYYVSILVNMINRLKMRSRSTSPSYKVRHTHGKLDTQSVYVLLLLYCRHIECMHSPTYFICPAEVHGGKLHSIARYAKWIRCEEAFSHSNKIGIYAIWKPPDVFEIMKNSTKKQQQQQPAHLGKTNECTI